jgi:hypothetical protein
MRNYQEEVVNNNREMTALDKPVLHDTGFQSRFKNSNMAFQKLFSNKVTSKLVKGKEPGPHYESDEEFVVPE